MNNATPIEIPATLREGVQLLREDRVAVDVWEPTKSEAAGDYSGWYEVNCVVCPAVPAGCKFPTRVRLRILVHPEYPFGEILVYPPESIRYYPHQDATTGKLCLLPDYKTLADLTRLSVYVRWSKEWLEDAATDNLLKEGDPYELPDFGQPESPGAPLVLFQEEAASFNWWRARFGRLGLFEFVPSPDGKRLFISKFMCGNEEYKPRWGSVVPNRNGKRGSWVLCPDELVIERRKPPLKWSELNSFLKAKGIDMKDVLEALRKSAVSSEGKFPLLLGFPIPSKFKGEPVEVHWQPVFVPNWDLTSGNPRGFRNIPSGRLEFALNHPDGSLAPSRSVPWGRSTNVSRNRFFGRGRIPNELEACRIAFIGCGTLGSSIAEFLVRGGLRSVVLFDGDTLLPGNLSRHECKLDRVGLQKAKGLAGDLALMSLHLEVDSFGASLPFSEKQANELKALESSDLWIDCSANDRVFRYLSKLAFSLKKVLIHTYATWGAEYLCACSGGTGQECWASHELVMSEQGKGSIPQNFFQEHSAGDMILEGAGCWHPTFPGAWYSISYLASSFVGFLCSLFPEDWRRPWALVMQNPWSSKHLKENSHPVVWFQELQ